MKFLISHRLKTNTRDRLPAYLDCTDNAGNTALFAACWARNVHVVKRLLQFNASSTTTNRSGDTALHEVALSMHKEKSFHDESHPGIQIALLLLHDDASVLTMENDEGMTPVQCSKGR